MRSVGIDLASPHNIYLGLAANTGIPGLIAFLVIAGSCLRRILVARRFGDAMLRSVATTFFVLLVGFLVSGVTEPIYRNGFKLQHLFWLFAGIGSFLPSWLPAPAQTVPDGDQTFSLGAVPGSGSPSPQIERIDFQ
jgi:O-antigen ligase